MRLIFEWDDTIMSKEFTLSHNSSLHYDVYSFEGDVTVTSLMQVTAELNVYTHKNLLKDLVLDLSGTGHIDSSGIRLIVNLKKKMESNNQQLFLLKPSQNVLGILEETNVHKILNIVDSNEALEKQILSKLYETYLPYTEEEDGLRRINLSCAVCGSKDVIGYLLDQNSLEWRWIGDDPFPVAFDKSSDKQVDFFTLSPIVCFECYMASIRVTDFNIITDNSVVRKSLIKDESKNLLTKSIKKRKKMMELDKTIGDNFFRHPRDELAIYKAYELAEFCARTISVLKKEISHFDVGYLNYLAIRYAEPHMRDIYINNCRTWFTQAMSKASDLSTFELAVSRFVLIVADLNLGKKKEASNLYSDFGKMVENLPSSVPSEGFTSPAFWYKQIEVIWEREIEEQSKAMKIKK